MPGKPIERFGSGLVRATVWKNFSMNGDEFNSVSLTKSYRKNGEWKNTNSLGVEDISQAIEALKQAQEFINNNSQDDMVV